MEEKYNPMKSAEIATEHNYNMLDGVLNNQAPPPEMCIRDSFRAPALLHYPQQFRRGPAVLWGCDDPLC